MKAEYVQEGKNLDYINPTDEIITAGTVIAFGAICAIAATNIPAGELGSIITHGAWEIPKDENEITAGAVVYYDEDGDKATATKKDVVLGYAIADAAATAKTVVVNLNGVAGINAG